MTSPPDASDTVRGEVAAMGGACFALHARRTANLLTRTYNAALAPVRIEVAQFATLCAVAADAPVSSSLLASYLGVERSTLVRNLKVLKRGGWIAERAGDVRGSAYELTADGLDLLKRALPLWQATQRRIDGHLDTAGASDPRDGLRALRRAAEHAALPPRA